MEREIEKTPRELERKNPDLLSYPRRGTANLPDTTSRLMNALQLSEDDLQRINMGKKDLTFREFFEHLRNHKVLRANPPAAMQEKPGSGRKAYLEYIQGCLENHKKDKNDELLLDEKKIGTSTHPLYDLYRFYRDY